MIVKKRLASPLENPNGEKIPVKMVQIGPKRVSRTFAQVGKNETDNF